MTHASEFPVVFSCGGDQLVGMVHPAAARLGVVIVVGGPQYRVGSHRQFVLMARDLAREGYPVLRFDYRGMGDSDGAVRGSATQATRPLREPVGPVALAR